MLRKDNSPQRSKYDLILTMAEEEEIHRTMDAVNISSASFIGHLKVQDGTYQRILDPRIKAIF